MAELLADAAIELVVVNTPSSTHFDLAQQALRAGKHVLLEKTSGYLRSRDARTVGLG